MLILRQSRPILSDKITIKTKVNIPWLETASVHSWKLTKKDFDFKLINTELFSRSKKNATNNKCLILEIEVIQMQITQICNLSH